MSSPDEPRRGQQRSVAELLAAYSAESRPPRRRRREDEDEPAPPVPDGYHRPGAPDRGDGAGYGYPSGGADWAGGSIVPAPPSPPVGYGLPADRGAAGSDGSSRTADSRSGAAWFGDPTAPPGAGPDAGPRGRHPEPPPRSFPDGAARPGWSGGASGPAYPGSYAPAPGARGGWYGTEPPTTTAYGTDPRAAAPGSFAPPARPHPAGDGAPWAGGGSVVPPPSVPGQEVDDAGPATAASPTARPAGAPEPRRSTDLPTAAAATSALAGVDDRRPAVDGGPPTASSPMDLDDDSEELPAAGPRREPTLRAGGTAMLRGDRPAGLDDDADDLDAVPHTRDEPDGAPTGAREWAIMIGQLVVGALVGAVLWLVFSYLWQKLPVVALFAAAAATTGLVFGVRAMRRSDDLQTTVWAVVVGLVVTVSPAAFVLINR